MRREYKIEEGVTVGGFVNTFLEAAEDSGMTDLNNMKLQKLLYFTYGLYSLGEKKALFSVNKIESWPYGPVFPDIYHNFKHLNNNPIDFRKIDEYKIKDDGWDFEANNFIEPKEEKIANEEIRNKIKNYTDVALYDLCLKDKSASELVDMTRSDYSLWSKEFQEKNSLSDQDKFETISLEAARVKPENTNNQTN